MPRTYHGFIRRQRSTCIDCGSVLQECYGYKRRKPYWACDGCGSGHHDDATRERLRAVWVAAGRPWLGLIAKA